MTVIASGVGSCAEARQRHQLQVGLAPVGCDGPAIRQKVASVLEHDDTITEQAPALLRVGGHDGGGLAVRRVGWWTRRLVWTVHDRPPVHTGGNRNYQSAPLG
jgi:hypothetical protein